MYASPRKPSEEATVALAGPAVTVILAVAFFGASLALTPTGKADAIVAVLDYLWLINALLLVFNLMPAFPLDGGRVLHSILWAISGKKIWAMRVAATVGLVFACLLIGFGALSLAGMAYGGGIWWILIGFFLFTAANAARKGIPV
jgi:Zn-dependent protease